MYVFQKELAILPQTNKATIIDEFTRINIYIILGKYFHIYFTRRLTLPRNNVDEHLGHCCNSSGIFRRNIVGGSGVYDWIWI